MIKGCSCNLSNELAIKFLDQWVFADSLDDPGSLDMLKNDLFEMKDISQNGMLYHQRRELDDGQLLFLVNSHSTKSASAEVTVQGKYIIVGYLNNLRSYQGNAAHQVWVNVPIAGNDGSAHR